MVLFQSNFITGLFSPVSNDIGFHDSFFDFQGAVAEPFYAIHRLFSRKSIYFTAIISLS